MKIAVFRYDASKSGWENHCRGECLDVELIEKEINEFCEDKDVVDIKVNTVEYDYHNSGRCNGIIIVYTIMYR